MSLSGHDSKPVGVLLAAGKSLRFGANKLLHPIDNHPSMLIASLDNMSSVIDHVYVVINPELENYRSRIEREGVHVLINPEADKGMASSLVCGIKASENATGWVIALADMPYIRPTTIRLLLDRFSPGQRIILPSYQGQKGHPVIFSRHYTSELLGLSGDTGGRNIIQQHRQWLERVQVDDPGVVKDIDVEDEII